MFTAMLSVKQIWKELSVSVIRNCWKHTGIYGDNTTLQSEISEINNNLQALEARMSMVVPVYAQMDISDSLIPKEEDACVEETNEESLVKCLLAPQKDEEKTETAWTVLPSPSFEKQLASVALCMQKCRVYTTLTVLLSQFSALRRYVRYVRINRASQTTLDRFKK